jgi:hypothetical protein
MEMNEKNIPQSIKNTQDPDKWKKKFIQVFNREKVIDFSNNGQIIPVDPKLYLLKPKALNK